MLNPRLATRYAKSVLDLAIEKGLLETVYKDMQYLQSLSKINREFVVVLKSPVITPDKKEAILKAVTKGKISELTDLFIRLLIRKGREMNLPEITNAFIDQYKVKQQIQTVKLITATEISDKLKQEITDKLKSQIKTKKIELSTEVDKDLIGGFVLEIGDAMVDASIAYDLKMIRKQFLNNDFIYKIR